VPAKAVENNTFDIGAKLDKRWEQRFPDLKCVMVPDPEKLQGNDRTEALKTRARYYNLDGVLPYRVLELDDNERIDLMDSDMMLLMGVDKKLWLAHRNRVKENVTPDETEDVIF
jgi:hypothetical protein